MDTNKLAQEVPVPSWWSREVFQCGVDAILRADRNQVDANYKAFLSDRTRGLPKTPRWWWVREHRAAPVHPAVNDALQWCPQNWQQLLLEWPHESEEGRHRLAYTPNEKYGEEDRQLVTSVGKYLKRHWPHVPDHLIRDIAARYTADQFKFVYTPHEMVRAVTEGPVSCMSSGFEDWDHHPYEVYAPEFGWHMAIRLRDNKIVGRALCLTVDGDHEKNVRYFVRTYARRSDNDSQSSRDEALEAWLIDQGLEHIPDGWPDGTKLAKIERHYTFIAPYLDASCDDNRRVTDCGDYLVIDSDGEWTFDDPCATPSRAADPEYTCDACDASIYEDDERYFVGRSESCVVCGDCVSDYTWVRGEGTSHGRYRNYREYYVPDDQAEPVIGQDYYVDNEHLPEGIVPLEDGRYADVEDTVYLSVEGEYYLRDDYQVVELAEYTDDGDSHALRNDAWQDSRTDKWFTFRQVKPVLLATGELVHPDTVYEDDTIAEPEALTAI